MQCPKCGSGAPDGSTQCHICFAPLENAPAASGPIGLQPQPPRSKQTDIDALEPGIPGLRPAPPESSPTPNYLSPGVPSQQMGGGGEVRVSLTGEVIEVASPSSRTTGPVGNPSSGGAPRPGGPMPPSGPPSSRGSYTLPARRETAPAKSGSGGVIAIIVVLLLLGGGGAAGWWFWQKSHGPAGAAEKMCKSLQSKDWNTFYDMIEWPADLKSQLDAMGGKTFLTGLLNSVGNMVTIKEFKIGESTITGDTGTVKVTITAEVNSPLGGSAKTSTTSTDMGFKLVSGQWKVDGASLKSSGQRALSGKGGGLPGFGF